MKISMRCVMAFLIIFVFLFLGACNKSKKEGDTDDSSKKISNADQFYLMIEQELEKAYQEAGQPEPSLESFDKVKDIAMDNINEDMSRLPTGGSYSLSVLQEGIFIYTKVDNKTKEGDWKP